MSVWACDERRTGGRVGTAGRGIRSWQKGKGHDADREVNASIQQMTSVTQLGGFCRADSGKIWAIYVVRSTSAGRISMYVCRSPPLSMGTSSDRYPVIPGSPLELPAAKHPAPNTYIPFFQSRTLGSSHIALLPNPSRHSVPPPHAHEHRPNYLSRRATRWNRAPITSNGWSTDYPTQACTADLRRLLVGPPLLVSWHLRHILTSVITVLRYLQRNKFLFYPASASETCREPATQSTLLS